MDPSSSATPLPAAALCAFQEAREAFFLFRSSDQRILVANPAAERATGLTADQLRSRRLTDLFVADAAGPAAPTTLGSHILSLHPDGQGRVPVRLRVHPVPTEGEPLGLATS